MQVSFKKEEIKEVKTSDTIVKQEDYESQSQDDNSQHSFVDSWLYTTILTNYHYSRKDCSRSFRVKIQQKQSTFNIHHSEDIIEKRLSSLMNFGYIVKRILKRPKPIYDPKSHQKIKDRYNIRRKVKLQFRCFNCAKNFTSIVGLFEIRFFLQVTDQKYKKAEVYFEPKIYKMQCADCKRYCPGKIYESQLRAVTRGFLLVISEIIQKIEPPKHYDRRHKLNEQVHDHQEQLCEACKKGVCFARPKGETKIQENDKDIKQQAQIQNEGKNE